MIELCLLIAFIFFIAVLFYRQRRNELEILQINEDQVADHLPDLLGEQQPIVIRETPPPYSLTPAGLNQIPRLNPFPVGTLTLGEVLAKPALAHVAHPLLDKAARQLLANELAIPIWANRAWFSRLAASSLLGPFIGTLQCEATIGGLGLRRCTAARTCILPTNGTYVASIVSRDSEEFLPNNWEGRAIATFTANDTPLVRELRCMDIVLRPGTMLCVPPHIIVSIDVKKELSAEEVPMLVWIEYHEPMSLLATTF